MAITIKSIPVLKKEAAIKFDSNAQAAIEKKSTVKFTEQLSIATKILAKAKI
ncbi:MULTISPECIES: hypothetical protein [Sphingobacterium]|uniref:hypothetical protein n=1 Tax=Sphingobacterium TaxID=28453 RepID=UPI00257A0C9F|nr:MULTISPECIES: hypothetical protein [Sphingobacterium]